VLCVTALIVYLHPFLVSVTFTLRMFLFMPWCAVLVLCTLGLDPSVAFNIELAYHCAKYLT
jgi:hypothetical protein